MSAYIVSEVNVKDTERYERYKTMVAPTLEAYGGRFLVRGGECQTLEGDWRPARMVVIEFDSVERAKAWWASTEYAPAKQVRQAAADAQMIVVQGV